MDVKFGVLIFAMMLCHLRLCRKEYTMIFLDGWAGYQAQALSGYYSKNLTAHHFIFNGWHNVQGFGVMQLHPVPRHHQTHGG